jgi:hypothetical protein
MASATFDPNAGIPLGRPGATILAVRFNPKNAQGVFQPLVNIVPISIQQSEGADPGHARFRYQFSELNDPSLPAHVEDVLGLDKSGPFVVSQDDRLCVLRVQPDGQTFTVLFDGFAQVPQGDLSHNHESATFTALGAAIRCWDTPMGGAVMRDCLDPTQVNDVSTDQPARFNPDGKPNRVPDGAFAGGGTPGVQYPTFLDVNLRRTPDLRTLWGIDDAAAYILSVGNDQKYVNNPSMTLLKTWLRSYVTPDENQGIDDKNPPPEPPDTPEGDEGDEEELDDPDNPADVDEEDDDPAQETPDAITCQDLDITGDPWPVALAKLLSPHNIGFSFRLGQQSGGTPFTYLDFYRMDDAGSSMMATARLQAVGSDINPLFSNTQGMSVERDGAGVANQIVVDTQCQRRECAVILAPGFPVAAADAADGTDKTFNMGDPGWKEDNRDKYRVYVFDEAGDGHWDFPSSSMKTDISSLDAIFGAPVNDPVSNKQVRQYVKRRRPALDHIYTTRNGKRLTAQLHISLKYNQPIPGVWDGSATDWQPVIGGWELLKDRLGIRITEATITSFTVGSKDDKNPKQGFPIPGGAFNLVKSQNNPTTDVNNPRVYFRLTCVLEGDKGSGTVAERRTGSTTNFTITRRVDARDRFVWHAIDKSSPFFVAGDYDDFRVDYFEAQAYAEALRAARENTSFSGHIQIPRISVAYPIGTQITGIAGRNISFRTNGGAAQGVAPQYPVVVGVAYDFEDRQSTTLTLSARRADPPDDRTRGYARRRH